MEKYNKIVMGSAKYPFLSGEKYYQYVRTQTDKLILEIIADVENETLTRDEMDGLINTINFLMPRGSGINQELNYKRNALNYEPPTLEALYEEQQHLPDGQKWVLMPFGQSIYHMKGENGVYNLKFISEDGKYEAVYNKDGELLNEKFDSNNMGTYNYGPLTKYDNFLDDIPFFRDTLPDGSLKHFTDDMWTYYIWGGVERDPIGFDSFWDRLTNAGAPELVETAEVTEYRQEILARLDGEDDDKDDEK